MLPYGLTEFDVHDVLNIFNCAGLNDEGKYFTKASPARSGDFFEFAEQDLLCALSTCPAGDLSIPFWGPDARDPIEVCRPLAVEVYRPADELTAGWSTPPCAAYEGLHGITLPTCSTGGQQD